MTSHYHGSKISGSQQLFLTDRTICIIEQWMKSMGYGFVPAAVMYRNVIHVIFFIICRTTFAQIQKFCYHGNVTQQLLSQIHRTKSQ